MNVLFRIKFSDYNPVLGTLLVSLVYLVVGDINSLNLLVVYFGFLLFVVMDSNIQII